MTPTEEAPEMDLEGLVKRIALPAGASVPTVLTYDGIELRALTREHLSQDVAGINASVELIHRTWGSSWPTGPVTEEENFLDLVWHEREFRDGDSFTYAIFSSQGDYLGCCYLYPVGRRRRLTTAMMRHDVDASWWVTPDAYAKGYYDKVYAGLQVWLRDRLPFTDPYFSNAVLPGKERL